jgi:hypothetical protein
MIDMDSIVITIIRVPKLDEAFSFVFSAQRIYDRSSLLAHPGY